MNLLPALLIMLYILKKSNVDILEILPRLDIPSFAPIFKLLGLNDETINFLSSDNFSETLKKISDGNGDIKSLLPLFSEVLKHSGKSSDKNARTEETVNRSANKTAEQENTFSCSADKTSPYFAPVKPIIPDDISSSFSEYFS